MSASRLVALLLGLTAVILAAWFFFGFDEMWRLIPTGLLIGFAYAALKTAASKEDKGDNK
ncbi:hypothetical protein ACRYJU_06180 [Alloalcanivorax xenomutans]|uniref:hypothetical protein n=1 Tax=Alloalcanivorax xenomutans TaxID=1094342 RepID=UPI000BC8EF15|nr:hypothetical protein [Alloalcanivorax xenomutans]SOC22393.1 hypothetical protein SAMN05877962_1197 [Alloalcanivorax xenomutans]